MKKPKNIICILFGHKENDFTDSGYAVCERCGNHEYYHGWEGSIFQEIWWKITCKIEWLRKEITTKYLKNSKNSEIPF